MAYNTTDYLTPNQSDEVVSGGAALGDGAHFFTTGSDSSVVELYRSTALDGTKLSALNALSFSTFAAAAGSGSGLKQPAYLRLTLDLDNDGAGDQSLFYEPAYNGTVTDGVWQSWNATAIGALWSADGSYASPQTLADLKTAYPNATIVPSTDSAALPGSGMGGVAFIVGASGANQTDGRFGLDQVVVNDTTFDLGPASWGEMAYNATDYLTPNQSDEAVSGAPLGAGAHLFRTGSDPSVVELYRSTALDGRRLSALSSLSYSSFAVAAAGSGVKQPAYLRLTIDNSGDGVGDASLFFEPAYNGTVNDGVWQSWDAMAAGALWSTDGSYTGADETTLGDYIAANGGATIVPSNDATAPAGAGMGGLAFIVGAAGDSQTDGVFGIDAVEVNGTTYDLEPAATSAGSGGGGGATSGPTPPPAPAGATGAESASSSTADGTATATSDETTVTATGVGAFTVSQYPGDPVEVDAPVSGTTSYFDVLAAAGSDFSSLAVKQCGLSADAHSIVWFNGTRWLKASPVSFANGCATVTITDTSSPTLSELTGTVFAAGALPVTRLSGPDRIATAVAVSQQRFPADGTADAVVLARSDEYPDALAGAPLAAENNAPLLLSHPGKLDGATLAEITRVANPGATVYLLGGDSALSSQVQSALDDAGYLTKRVAGSNRYATAVAIARALGNPQTVFEAPGTNFPDALSAGPAASKTQAAILLTHGRRQATETAAYLAKHSGDKRYAIGGVSASADPKAEKVSGTDRYATSAAVAGRFFPATRTVNLATGENFPDALTGGPMANVPMVLVRGTSETLPEPALSYLTDAAATVTRLNALGGDGVLGDAVVTKAQLALQ
jgi:putative cell wall-binding protein